MNPDTSEVDMDLIEELEALDLYSLEVDSWRPSILCDLRCSVYQEEVRENNSSTWRKWTHILVGDRVYLRTVEYFKGEFRQHPFSLTRPALKIDDNTRAGILAAPSREGVKIVRRHNFEIDLSIHDMKKVNQDRGTFEWDNSLTLFMYHILNSSHICTQTFTEINANSHYKKILSEAIRPHCTFDLEPPPMPESEKALDIETIKAYEDDENFASW